MSETKKPDTALVPTAGVQGIMQITGGSTPMPMPEEFAALTNAAAWIFRSHAFPQYRTAEEVFVGMLFVREMGVNLTMGLSKGYSVHGKFDIEAKVKLAAIKARVPSFQYEFKVSDEQRCVFNARLLPSDPWTQTEYTIEKAKKAGLTKGRDGSESPDAAWQAHRAEMLQWRAVSRWLNLYGGHVLYTLPTLVTQDALAEAAEVEEAVVVESRPLPPSPDPAAPGPAARPAPAPSAKSEWLRIAHGQGYPSGRGSGPKLLELANLLMKHLGFSLVRASSELGETDYANMVAEMQRRGWDKEGAGTPTEAAKEPAQPQTEPAPKGFDEQAADASYGADTEPVEAIDFPTPEPEPGTEEVDPEDEEPPLSESLTLADSVKAGNAVALIELGESFTAQLARDGHSRAFVRLDYPKPGHDWFVDAKILIGCASTRDVGGKPAATPALLRCPVGSEYERMLASEGLRQMIGMKLWEEYTEFQSTGQHRPNVLSAKSQARMDSGR
jgi:hypothetical protein